MKKSILFVLMISLILSPVAFSASDSESQPKVRSWDDTKPVLINSRNYVQTSGNSIGFQSKPAQTVTSTGAVIGGEISPRVNDDIDIADVRGLHTDVYLKGTSSRTISGNVAVHEVELVTDDAGVSAITGYVAAIRIRSVFSAAVTGVMSAIRIELPEVQTGSHPYDAVLDLTGAQAGVWNDTPGTEPTTADGYIKVVVDGSVRYIQLYSGAPVD
ncbi:MAG: hypothetical protein ACHQ1D_00815 [Nitrososphaerales archaeon]